MKEFAILKEAIENQRTITTKRLGPIIANIQKSYIQTSKKVARQEETIKKINDNYNHLAARIAREKK